MTDINTLHANIQERFAAIILQAHVNLGELTIEVSPDNLLDLALALRDQAEFDFNLLADVCGVDYLHYGLAEWETQSATTSGFERGVNVIGTTARQSTVHRGSARRDERFGVVYHLLSLTHNHRLRIRVLLHEASLVVPSVVEIWPAANWFEREAFDLYGILFVGHPDLRRILTDYGFIGHPFRKDFPLIGNVEVRYDATLRRVVYEPVSIQPRILEPKVIRDDNRYETGE
jgi:NADH-quinone oxidoreductase subunit C